jgi:succinate dehydrogenase / fumarate reductase cytochrome b subunit
MRRVLAFTGVAPLAAFVVVHAITTSTAVMGSARFDRIFAHPTRAMTALTSIFLLAPLLFHAAFGTYVALANKKIGAPDFAPRLRRVAAIATLLFLAYHVADVPMRVWTRAVQPEGLHDLLVAQLSSTVLGFPLRAVVYILGLGATAFHLASSLWTFCSTWGLTVTARAQRASAWGFGALGLLVFLVGGNTVVFFATGSRIVGPHIEMPLDGVLPHSPCPQSEK